MKGFSVRRFVVFALGAMSAGFAHATTQTVSPPFADTQVYLSAPGTNYGAFVLMRVSDDGGGAGGTPGLRRRTLVEFDPLPPLPGAEVLQQATLRLRKNGAFANTVAPRTVLVYRITQPWTEGGVTWSNQPTIAGAPTSSAVLAAMNQFYNWDVTADVAYWYANPGLNYGLMVVDVNEADTTPALSEFDTKELGIAAQDPELVILSVADTFTMTATPSATRTSTPTATFCATPTAGGPTDTRTSTPTLSATTTATVPACNTNYFFTDDPSGADPPAQTLQGFVTDPGCVPLLLPNGTCQEWVAPPNGGACQQLNSMAFNLYVHATGGGATNVRIRASICNTGACPGTPFLDTTVPVTQQGACPGTPIQYVWTGTQFIQNGQRLSIELCGDVGQVRFCYDFGSCASSLCVNTSACPPPTSTNTSTPSNSPTRSATGTVSGTSSNSGTATVTPTITATFPASFSASVTATRTVSGTATRSATATNSASTTATASATNLPCTNFWSFTDDASGVDPGAQLLFNTGPNDPACVANTLNGGQCQLFVTTTNAGPCRQVNALYFNLYVHATGGGATNVRIRASTCVAGTCPGGAPFLDVLVPVVQAGGCPGPTVQYAWTGTQFLQTGDRIAVEICGDSGQIEFCYDFGTCNSTMCESSSPCPPPTVTNSATASQTATRSSTGTVTRSATNSGSATSTPTITETFPAAFSPSVTATATISGTSTRTTTPSPTASASATASSTAVPCTNVWSFTDDLSGVDPGSQVLFDTGPNDPACVALVLAAGTCQRFVTTTNFGACRQINALVFNLYVHATTGGATNVRIRAGICNAGACAGASPFLDTLVPVVQSGACPGPTVAYTWTGTQFLQNGQRITVEICADAGPIRLCYDFGSCDSTMCESSTACPPPTATNTFTPSGTTTPTFTVTATPTITATFPVGFSASLTTTQTATGTITSTPTQAGCTTVYSFNDDPSGSQPGAQLLTAAGPNEFACVALGLSSGSCQLFVAPINGGACQQLSALNFFLYVRATTSGANVRLRASICASPGCPVTPFLDTTVALPTVSGCASNQILYTWTGAQQIPTGSRLAIEVCGDSGSIEFCYDNGACNSTVCAALAVCPPGSPTATGTPTRSATRTASASTTATRTTTGTGTSSASVTATRSITATATPSGTALPGSPTFSGTVSGTETVTTTATRSATPTATTTVSATATVSTTVTASGTSSQTATPCSAVYSFRDDPAAGEAAGVQSLLPGPNNGSCVAYQPGAGACRAFVAPPNFGGCQLLTQLSFSLFVHATTGAAANVRIRAYVCFAGGCPGGGPFLDVPVPVVQDTGCPGALVTYTWTGSQPIATGQRLAVEICDDAGQIRFCYDNTSCDSTLCVVTSACNTPTATGTATVSASTTGTRTASVSATSTRSATGTTTGTGTVTPTITATFPPAFTPSTSATETVSGTSSATASASPTASVSSTPPPSSTATFSATASATLPPCTTTNFFHNEADFFGDAPAMQLSGGGPNNGAACSSSALAAGVCDTWVATPNFAGCQQLTTLNFFLYVHATTGGATNVRIRASVCVTGACPAAPFVDVLVPVVQSGACPGPAVVYSWTGSQQIPTGSRLSIEICGDGGPIEFCYDFGSCNSSICFAQIPCGTPTATVTTSATVTRSATPSASASASGTSSPTATAMPGSATETATAIPLTVTGTVTVTVSETSSLTSSRTATSTDTPVPPTGTFTFTATFSDTQTATAVPPSATLTPTAVPPTATNTAVPPSATDTSVPATPTNSAVPSSSTETPTAVPLTVSGTVTVTVSETSSPTSSRTATSTNTPVPPTATDSATAVPPTSTFTPVPPTSTDTPVPPTATESPTGAPGTSTDSPTAVPPTDTSTPAPPTSTATPVPPTATDTPVPPSTTFTFTATLSDTPLPPTSTSTAVPPTATDSATAVPPTSSFTPVPPTSTDTPVPPTATESPTGAPGTSTDSPTAVPPTNTFTPAPPTSTATPVPPTATDTPVPPSTTFTFTATLSDTPLPPTSTSTAVPPTATDSATAVPPTSSFTPVPPTSTDTPVPPTATDTPMPTSTDTPTAPAPTSTDTPTVPAATDTDTPVPPTTTDTPTVPAPTDTDTPVPPTSTDTPLPLTVTGSVTVTVSETSSSTSSRTATPTNSYTATSTVTPTAVPTNTFTITPTPPSVPTPFPTATFTATPVPPSPTATFPPIGVVPNPSNGSVSLQFVGCPDGSKIYVYNVRGELIVSPPLTADAFGRAFWTPKKSVEGTYPFLVRLDGKLVGRGVVAIKK